MREGMGQPGQRLLTDSENKIVGATLFRNL